jgi:hypothetical protein
MFLTAVRFSLLAVLVVLTSCLSAGARTLADPLSSWNDGTAKQAILDFVRNMTDAASTSYVLPEDRIATFDQDGTLWVEHPIYTQMVYGLERVPALVATKPELKNIEPFKPSSPATATRLLSSQQMTTLKFSAPRSPA